MSGKRIPAIWVWFFILFFFSGAALKAAEGDLDWAKRAGGPGTDEGWRIAAYGDGSSVVTGWFSQTATFGAGEAKQTSLVSAGDYDMFIAKYNPDGTITWAKRAGGTAIDGSRGIASYVDGSSVTTGAFQETATFGAGEAKQTSLVSAGDYDMFIARYNADGTLEWAKRVGSATEDVGYGVASYEDGSSVVTGWFSQTAIFGAGEGNQTTLVAAGDRDIFIAKYTAAGTLTWAKRAGSSASPGHEDQGMDITSYRDGSCVVTGRFHQTAIFGPGEANQTSLVSAGAGDMFIARYNANGTLAWAKRVGSINGDWGYGVASLEDGSSVVTGSFWGTVTFGPGEPKQTILSSAGGDDIFIARYNAAGTLDWAKKAGGGSGDIGYGIASYQDGSSVVGGAFSTTATFGAGESNQTILVSAGDSDIFVARYNADGTLNWARRAGGISTTNRDEGLAVASYRDGSCVITGYFQGTGRFGAGEAKETNLVSAGVNDIFVAKYSGHPWSLPAGASAIGGVVFDSYVLIANPGNQTAQARVQFVGKSGPLTSTDQNVGPRSRKTIKISDFVAHTNPNAGAVSTIVSSLNSIPVLCERAMYWPGGAGWTSWTGGHDTIGTSDPTMEWNLPEGATHIFDEYIHVLNPGTSWASATATFMNQVGFTWQTQAMINGLSNWTINVNDVVGSETQVSTRVSSSHSEVAVDRTMYWPKGGPLVWRGGHCSRGISNPSTFWYLAEGANHIFDHYVLVSNPSVTETANVKFTFMDKAGATATYTHSVGPRSRFTVKVNDIAGWGGKDQVSTTVESTNAVPIFAERAMYWPKGGPAVWRGGHNSIGSSSPATRWQLPEGANHIFDHYVLVANPSSSESANVTFTFMDRFGATTNHTHVVGPRSRYTVKVNDIPGWGTKDQVSTTVEADVSVLAERAMYWPKGGASVWTDGHATVGIEE